MPTRKATALMYVRDRSFKIAEDDWCATCKWATFVNSGKWYCPFVQGSCARIKESIEKPKRNMTDEYMMRAEYIKQEARIAERNKKWEALKKLMRDIEESEKNDAETERQDT